MPSCIVKSCKNASDKPETRHGFSFHKFPREPILRTKWVNIIRKTRSDENWTPSMHCVVCSAHFDDKYLYCTKSGLRRVSQKAVPTKNLFVSTNIPIDIDTTTDQKHHPTDERLSSPKSEYAVDFDDLPRSTNISPQPGSSTDTYMDINPYIDVKIEHIDPPQVEDVNLKTENKEEKTEKELAKPRISVWRKLKTLQQKVRRLKKRNTVLESLLKELLEKHLINVVDTQKLMSENAVLTGLLRSVHMRPAADKLAPADTAEDDGQ